MKREEFLKLKVGDKVKIVDKRPEHKEGGIYFNPDMSKWLGKVMTVKRLWFYHSTEPCVTLEDCYYPDSYVIGDKDDWLWSAYMIERKIEEKKPDILRVRCVKSSSYEFTAGKVYERVNGYLMSDCGCLFHNLCRDDDPTKWGFTGIKFELADSKERYPQIVIKQDGNTVTAYCGSAKGVAQCSPDDTFDLYTGAQLALARAFDREEKKDKKDPYSLKIDWDGFRRRITKDFEEATKNMYKLADDIERASKKEEPKKIKVKCVEARGDCFKEGKIYEWVDDTLTDENDYTFRSTCHGSDPSKWSFVNYKFELYEEPKKIKVKCVEAKRTSFTVGKIYEWVDGKLKDDDGFTFHLWCQGSDPSAWDFHNYKFELVDVLKVRCIESPSRNFAKGKVYERIDGVMTDDYGYEWKTSCRNDDPKYWGFIHHKFELAE